ncbi:hypothetical protein ABN034_10195 [Actinopolymorpha sp. B11F2]|uniref:hypothetical protein n=1 Tax=Actinopolymorpha sp. B11F2 TaxID=3160862 RepID=UPI0032E506AE
MEEAGWSAPEGRRYHVCYGQPGKLRVIQVWDSEQQLRTYYQALYPILLKVGVAPVEPYLEDVYHILEGRQPC